MLPSPPTCYRLFCLLGAGAASGQKFASGHISLEALLSCLRPQLTLLLATCAHVEVLLSPELFLLYVWLRVCVCFFFFFKSVLSPFELLESWGCLIHPAGSAVNRTCRGPLHVGRRHRHGVSFPSLPHEARAPLGVFFSLSQVC